MLLQSQLFLVAVHFYLGFTYVLYVAGLMVLEYEFQHRIVTKVYNDGTFEFSKCHYSLYGISNSMLDLSPFLSNSLWVDVRISSLEKEVSDIIFINFMLMTLSIYDIRVQKFSIWCTAWSYSHIGILALCLYLCLGVLLNNFSLCRLVVKYRKCVLISYASVLMQLCLIFNIFDHFSKKKTKIPL